MRKYDCWIGLLLPFLLASACQAQEDVAILLKRVPEWANALTVVRLKALLESPFQPGKLRFRKPRFDIAISHRVSLRPLYEVGEANTVGHSLFAVARNAFRLDSILI